MAAVLKAFAFTFEQCWKSMQKQAGTEGVTVASPKKALEWAMSAGWISPANEATWLKMLDDRNLTSHTYKELVAKEVSTHVRTAYLGEFERIFQKMKSV